MDAAREALSALPYAALVGLAFAPLERLWPAHAIRRRRFATDALFATAVAALTRLTLFVALGEVLARAGRASIALGLGDASPLMSLSPLARIPLALLLFEIAGYAYHRLAHRVPALYRLHAVHHSSDTMDWLASFRQHPLEIVLMTLAQNLPLVVLGLPIAEHATIVLLLALSTALVHANLRVPRAIGLVLATPRFHHRHHDADAPTANYASLFPWLDRLFGTYDDAPAARFGTEACPADTSFWRLLLASPRR